MGVLNLRVGMSYYKTIKGVRYDRELLEAADKVIGSKADGRLGVADARMLVKEAQDGQGITTCEKETLKYIRDNYKCTPTATAFFDTSIDAVEAGLEPPMNTPAKTAAPPFVPRSAARATPQAFASRTPTAAAYTPKAAPRPAAVNSPTMSARSLAGYDTYEWGIVIIVILICILVVMALGTYLCACGISERMLESAVCGMVRPIYLHKGGLIF